MPGTTVRCRVCGKEYQACKALSTNDVFRWQNVACSPECGYKYFKEVLSARGEDSLELDKAFGVKAEAPAPKKSRKRKDPEPAVEEPVVSETKNEEASEEE